MKKLLVRSISGLIYAALIFFPIYFKLPGFYVGVFSLIIVLGIWEYTALVSLNKTRWLRTILDSIAAAYLFVASVLYLSNSFSAKAFIPYIFYLLYMAVRNVYSGRDTLVSDLSRTLMGQVYIAIPLVVANLIAFAPDAIGFEEMRSEHLLLVFILIWVNDTGAYLSGVTMGRHKLFPSVSPKKTWEGFIGGALLTTISATLLGHYFIDGQVAWYIWALIGLVISLAATWGDLFESCLKRGANYKDSGHLIPGHGGILDRIDSLLFALPSAYVLYSIFL